VAADDGTYQGGYLYADSTLDAKFTLDGLNLTRGSNCVTDALTRITLTMHSTQAANAMPITLTAGADEDGIKAKVHTFPDSYNTMIRFLAKRTSTKVSTSLSTTGSTSVNSIQRGTLDVEPAYLNLWIGLRSDIGGRVGSAASGEPAALSEIGITTGSDGTLSITDSAKFSVALKKPSGVTALFSSSDGISTRVQIRLTGFFSPGGVLDRSPDAVISRQHHTSSSSSKRRCRR
jgi:flagellar hook-associated protein 2